MDSCNWADSNKIEKNSDTITNDSVDQAKIVELSQLQYQTIKVVLGKMEKKDLKSVVKANGYLKLPPQKSASISTFMGGVVKNIYVIEGKYVKKDQVLATIEHPDFTRIQEEYLKTKDNLKFIQKDYERQKILYDNNIASGKVFQQTEANYESQLSKLASLTDQLRKLSISLEELEKKKIVSQIPIKAPFSGYINKVNITIGSFAEPVKTIFELVDNSHIHAELMVYEQDWYKVKTGQKVAFYLPNEKDLEIMGEIFAVGKSFDPITRALSVHVEILNNEKIGLVPGVYVNGLIDVGKARVNALPVQAVVESGDKKYVFVFKKKQMQSNENFYVYEMKEVETGVTELEFVEVKSLDKISSSDSIVINGAYYLLSQLKNTGEE
ncbi:MAG: efflux RND transporter periplasmic adaptor subunit [Sporocytophaga sp.]|nr:efflux RND transporter periplasmic adaptor subunit [Sporocytophaga sp.]